MNLYSTYGLILDLIGVLLLFYYGLPSKYKEYEPLELSQTKEMQNKNDDSNKKIKFRALIGLYFVILGFVLQIIGTKIQCF